MLRHCEDNLSLYFRQEFFHPVDELGGELDRCHSLLLCWRWFESILVDIPFTPEIPIQDDPFQFQCSGCHIGVKVLFDAEMALFTNTITKENSPGSMKDRDVSTVCCCPEEAGFSCFFCFMEIIPSSTKRLPCFFF